MIRILLAGAVWVAFAGGVAAYMHLRHAPEGPRKAMADQPRAADRAYALELTLTFDAQPDPFALDAGGGDVPPVVSVRLNGVVVAALTETGGPGIPWHKDQIPGVAAGANELLIEASPPMGGPGARHAARIRLLTEGQPVADATFWSEAGAKITGTLPFEIRQAEEDGHDH